MSQPPSYLGSVQPYRKTSAVSAANNLTDAVARGRGDVVERQLAVVDVVGVRVVSRHAAADLAAVVGDEAGDLLDVGARDAVALGLLEERADQGPLVAGDVLAVLVDAIVGNDHRLEPIGLETLDPVRQYLRLFARHLGVDGEAGAETAATAVDTQRQGGQRGRRREEGEAEVGEATGRESRCEHCGLVKMEGVSRHYKCSLGGDDGLGRTRRLTLGLSLFFFTTEC